MDFPPTECGQLQHVWLFSRCQETLKFTLNLCLVDDKVLVVSTAFKLFPLAPIETHALVLQLMQGEEGRWESAVASISSEHSQRFLLEHNSHYTLKTHSRAAYKSPTSTHPLCAHVHALIHRHVLDDRAEGESQCDIVWPVETPFENGTAI